MFIIIKHETRKKSWKWKKKLADKSWCNGRCCLARRKWVNERGSERSPFVNLDGKLRVAENCRIWDWYCGYFNKSVVKVEYFVK